MLSQRRSLPHVGAREALDGELAEAELEKSEHANRLCQQRRQSAALRSDPLGGARKRGRVLVCMCVLVPAEVDVGIFVVQILDSGTALVGFLAWAFRTGRCGFN